MKSLVAAAMIFASTALAAKYAAGTNCHSNIECEDNCVDRQFGIVTLDGGYIFACDPNVDDPTDWYTLECLSFRNDDDTTEAVTQAACEELDGQFCQRYCVLSGKRSLDEENRAKWDQTCGPDSQGEATHPMIQVKNGEEDAKKFCKRAIR